jgi:hypothetical protein
MLPFTKSDSVALASALVADNDVAATLEPADGTVSLEANAYEEFVVETRFNNLVAAVVSASVQFYKKATNDGDVSATWTLAGVYPLTAPIVEASAATAGEKVLTARLHSRHIDVKYVTAIVALTFADQGAATFAASTLRGEIKRRDI